MSLLPRTNILSVLGVEAKEDVIANLLAYSLNHSRVFQAAFLRSVCRKDPGIFLRVRAVARPPVAGMGAADLLLECEWEAGTAALVVCHQIHPEPESGQNIHYGSEEFLVALRERLGNLAEPPGYVFLSLFPNRRPPAGLPWTAATYRDLLAGLQQFPASRESIAEQLVNDWADVLRRFYEHAGISPEKRLADYLASEDGLEGGFLSFQAMFSGLRLPSWLGVDRLYRKSAGAGRCYAASISKQHWHPAAMQQDEEGQWRLPAGKPCHIFLELLYDLPARRFRVQVRYEPPGFPTERLTERPTERWMKQNLPLAAYEAYHEHRRRFLEEAARHGADGLAWEGSQNAAAKAELDVEGRSVTQICVWLERILFDASLAIDRTLESLAESLAEPSAESLAESLAPESLAESQTSQPVQTSAELAEQTPSEEAQAKPSEPVLPSEPESAAEARETPEVAAEVSAEERPAIVPAEPEQKPFPEIPKIPEKAGAAVRPEPPPAVAVTEIPKPPPKRKPTVAPRKKPAAKARPAAKKKAVQAKAGKPKPVAKAGKKQRKAEAAAPERARQKTTPAAGRRRARSQSGGSGESG